MPTPYLDSLYAKRAELTDAGNAILDTAGESKRSLTDDERARVEKYQGECRALDTEIENIEAVDDSAAKFAAMVTNRRQRNEEHARAESRDADERDADEPKPRETRSIGQQFVESEAFRNYRGRGTSQAVEFDDYLKIQTRAPITTDDLAIPPHQFTGNVGYRTTAPLLAIVGREAVTSNSVTYIDWGGGDPLAGGPIPEGDLKPEANIVGTEVPLVIDTYAHWKGITRQALEDYPRISSIVEGKLRGGLVDKLEQGAAAALTASTTIPDVAADDLLTGIRLAVADIQARGFVPNAVVLNPADYAQLDIEASAGANSGPVAFGNFWGLRPIPAGAVPSGTAYVGDFGQGLTWFDRNSTSVFMTDSHADYFIRNTLVLLAEARAAFAVTDAGALARVTATAPAPEALTASASKAK